MTHEDLNVTFDDVKEAMKEDGWDINECTPLEIFLGIGLGNFIFDEIVRKNEEPPKTTKTYEGKEWEENKQC